MVRLLVLRGTEVENSQGNEYGFVNHLIEASIGHVDAGGIKLTFKSCR